jgi:hypothetical protein
LISFSPFLVSLSFYFPPPLIFRLNKVFSSK